MVSFVKKSNEAGLPPTSWSGQSAFESLPQSAAAIFYSLPTRFFADYRTHKKLIDRSIGDVEVSPLLYAVAPMYLKEVYDSSGHSNVTAAAIAHYDEVENCLAELSADTAEEERVEKGAVQSAIQIVHQLRRKNVAPPEVSWHGGDAIVMLWALGDTTCAITVTDGEFGYVVRRNRQSLKIADSITLDRLMIEDLR